VSPDESAIEREFNLVHAEWQFPPSFNVAPTQSVPIVRTVEGTRRGALMRWGLIPYFARGVPPKYSTINARVETVQTAASYRGPWTRAQRCLVVAKGFFEWVRHEVASVIVRRTPFGRTCRPIGSTLGGMAAW
jgi:putative SOS response-associated peptidase YedK